MKVSDKFILGTANFINSYGIKKKNVSSIKALKIIKLAAKYRVNTIDSSPAYGESEKILSNVKADLKIYSKINKFPKYYKNEQIKVKIVTSIFKTLKNLNKSKIHGLLLQDTDILLSNKGKIIFQTLKEIKKMKLTKYIGISIYNFGSLKKIINKFKFDFVQVPFNLLNRDLLKNNILNILKKKNIKIHVRSVFLQGILLLKKKSLPKKLKSLSKEIDKYNNWAKSKKTNLFDMCLNFVLSHNIDKIVVGVNNTKELKKLLKFNFKKIKINDLPVIKIKNKKLAHPNKWRNL